MSTVQDASVLVSKPSSPALSQRILRLWTYRGLLLNLIRRDLRVRYKESALGFIWSLLNPATYLAIFYVVFVIILPAGIPSFPVFLLSGLLPWTLFQNSMMAATSSVVGGAPLIKRVAFPREVLPLAAIGANIFHFFLQMIVLLGFMLIFGYGFLSRYTVLFIPALIVEVLLLTGLGLMVSSVTVYLRDMTHFMELATLFWFWMTPVVYPPYLVYDKLTRHHIPFKLALLNPMTPVVMAFQRAFYKTPSPTTVDHNGVVTYHHILVNQFHLSWYFEVLGLIALVSVALIWIGFHVFAKGEGNFAEEL
ncbi:MAG TPA: ABC transporter permease [Actinomycetota bacterium]|nr:ABC transporter permease [Actinomycetota bacterium]